MSLSSSTGLLSGTIGLSADGGSPYQVNVTADFAGASDTGSFLWNVQPAVALLNPGSAGGCDGQG